MIPMTAVLVVIMGCVGMIIHRKNMVMLMMCVEVVCLGAQTYGVYVGYVLQLTDVFLWVVAMMTIAALESAIGLALIITLYKHKNTINSDAYTMLRDVQ